MSNQNSLISDHAQPLQILDVETVCETKPVSSVSSEFSIFSGHNLSTLFRLLRKIVSTPFQTSIYYIELVGVERISNEKIVVVYIGDKSAYEYVVSSLFVTEPEVRCQKPLSWWSINRQLNDASETVDLLICDIDFPLNFLLNKQGALVLPRWVKQKVDIADQWADVLENLRRKTRREALRSIRANNLKACVVRDQGNDHYFYHQLYKPYIHRRYGKQAVLVDENRFLQECANGQLLQLKKNDTVLAVVLVHISGKQLTIAWTGIANDIEDAQLNGIADALDLYTLMFAYSRSCNVMDMGGSRPLVNDGVLRYKKKWGSVVSQGLIPKGVFTYRLCRLTKAVESFLENNPMLLSEGKKLRCLCWDFTTGDTISTEVDLDYFMALFKKMYQPGIDEFQCYYIVNKDDQDDIKGIVAGQPYCITPISRSRLLAVLSGISS